MDMKKVCLAVIGAESENEVATILGSTPEMLEPNNWVPLDRRETNHNVTTNQQAYGPKAASELMTNMRGRAAA
jgi:expansin (peptidoglycan-binding protein)